MEEMKWKNRFKLACMACTVCFVGLLSTGTSAVFTAKSCEEIAREYSQLSSENAALREKNSQMAHQIEVDTARIGELENQAQ